MKRIEHNKYLVLAFVALALAGILSSCLPEMRPVVNRGYNDGHLFVKGTVSDAVVATRAASVVDLKEKQLNTLDVFVQSASDGKYINQFHLVATENKPIQEQVNNLLAEYWRDEHLEVGENYNIYIAVNNPLTRDTVDDLSTFDATALKANEVKEGIAVVGDDGNIASINGVTTGNIYKLYSADPGSYRALTSEKEFMMDGIIKNWTPDGTKQDQVFEVTLNRAAAKFVVKVNFDSTFLKTLTYNMKVEGNDTTWTEKPADEKVTITGSPAWKFYNFAFGAPVFTPATAPTDTAGMEIHNSGFNIFHNQTYTGDDKHFTITTYSYPNVWEKDKYSTDAPSLVVSVGFTQNGVTNYHYYRIPLVKNTVTSIERNHIYVVNATIATRGSAATEDKDVTEDIKYAVLPWNDKSNDEVIENTVESIQHYYFNVNPKVYTLRGDGDQTVVLNYSKASGTKVAWKLFEIDPETEAKGEAVVSTDPDAVWGWFYDSNGDMMTSYNDNSGTNWNHMGVTIAQSGEGTSGSKGTVTVTSTALNNKAIKYMLLRVYLDEEDTFDPVTGEPTMYEDIIIRHFPTDNIQSINGFWSSYHPTGSSDTQMVTLTTRILSEAQSWAEQYNVDFASEDISETETITYATYVAHSGEEGYSADIVSGVTVDEMYNAAGYNWNSTIRNANSQANAFLSDGWYYWGENPTSATNNNYDYYTGNGGNRRYYIYTTRYRAQYFHTTTYTLYSVTVPMASTGTWVDWDNRSSHSPARTYTITYGNNAGTFNAKVMQNGTMYSITESGSGGYNQSYTTTTGSSQTLTNYHMYVIQISSTSDEYVLGRPYVNQTTHQSQDNVVSPAFMIASQLGAVLPFTGNNGPANAATHCSQYMEVAQDGTRYTGWRLPTEAEISVITDYQYGNIGGVTIPNEYRVLSPVLTGRYYHSLSGREVEANPNADSQSQTKSYLRCVRDLSAAEVNRLNGFDKIQEKYR